MAQEVADVFVQLMPEGPGGAKPLALADFAASEAGNGGYLAFQMQEDILHIDF